MNVYIVQKLSASYDGEKKILPSRPGRTRPIIEEVVRNANMSRKQNVGKGKGQTNGDDPHALYAGGAQPAGAGGNGMERDSKGKQRNKNKTAKTAVATAAAAAAAAAPAPAAAAPEWR